MSRVRRHWRHLRLNRWLAIGLPMRGVHLAIGRPGRRLTIGSRGITLRLCGVTLHWTWRAARLGRRTARKQRGD